VTWFTLAAGAGGTGASVRVDLFRHPDHRLQAIVFFAVRRSLVPHDMLYGPQAAPIAGSFTARLRHSGKDIQENVNHGDIRFTVIVSLR
jgi:hypothetical protein